MGEKVEMNGLVDESKRCKYIYIINETRKERNESNKKKREEREKKEPTLMALEEGEDLIKDSLTSHPLSLSFSVIKMPSSSSSCFVVVCLSLYI